MASTKIVAEYAKSNRSSCKKCTKSISANTLRLGLVSRDGRGFDMTKWHHLNCFPIDSEPIVSVDAIDGFTSLKSSDQEELKKLTDGCDRLPKEDSDGEKEGDDGSDEKKEGDEGSNEKSLKELKDRKSDEAGPDELEESDSKKLKILAEYAKSNRSSCKKCTNTISANTLRLALVSRERGFNMIKWHHLNCFPIESHPIISVDEINGFSSLKSSDQEAVKKLMAGCDGLPKEECDGEKEGVEGSDEKSLKEFILRKSDEAGLDELEKSNSKKLKVCKEDEAARDEHKESKSKKLKIVAEYAKSNRSSCKKCTKTISANTLRLGLVSRDSRGFDMTKWHHLNCFPTDSQPIVSVDEINGFSSLKSSDQEALKKLTAGCDGLPKEGCDGQEDGVEGSDEKSLKEFKEAELEIAFSVSDTKNNYKEATLFPKWKAFQTVIFLERDEGLHDSAKIAAFDFDGCLANTSVRRVGPDAWSLMYSSIPEKLKSLYEDGYKLVIFTNESNIERWKNKRQVAVDSKIGRLNNFINHVKVPIQVFIACGLGKTDGQTEDPFRKPKPGMWRLMEQQFNSGIAIDMDQSFYVGDAAGRKNDHSDADIRFAQLFPCAECRTSIT
ncbi:zinc finger protein [Macleaya cordata]|uniref:Zinc finger protein n=1 Tax=Macleaya cordata TaxID=56857 RepID=A0A200PUI7_MACCD|nr:zinc finger protein [Macleaya cordata]